MWLKYDVNGGNIETQPDPVYKIHVGEPIEIEITDIIPVRPGYKFVGWKENGSDIIYRKRR